MDIFMLKCKKTCMGSCKQVISTRSAWNLHPTTRLLSRQTHTRIMAAQTTKHPILSHCEWLWSQIDKQIRCWTPPQSFNTTLWGIHWLDHEKICWLHLGLGLPKQTGCIDVALTTFKHKHPDKPQHQPFPHAPPQYGVHPQHLLTEGTSLSTNKNDKNSSSKSPEHYVLCPSYQQYNVNSTQCHHCWTGSTYTTNT